MNCKNCKKKQPKYYVDGMFFCDENCYLEYLEKVKSGKIKSNLTLYQQALKNVRQLTREEVFFYAKTEFWKAWDDRKIAEFQIMQDRICIPMNVYMYAMARTLKRQVYEHELLLSRDRLYTELMGLIGEPSIEEIMELLPEDKMVLLKEKYYAVEDEKDEDKDKKAYQKTPF